MCQKFTHFKIVIKTLHGGRLAWTLAHDWASEGKDSLGKNLLMLYLSRKSGLGFTRALLSLLKDTLNVCL